MSSADRPSEASVGAAIWAPRSFKRRTRIWPRSPRRRATKASAAGARRARGVSLAYPGGRVPAAKVDDQPLFDTASAARSRCRFEDVRRRCRPADHVGGRGGTLEVGAGQLVHRFGEPEICEGVECVDDVGDHRLESVLLSGAEGRLAGAGRRRNRRDDRSWRFGLQLRQLPPVGDEPLGARLRRIVDRVHLERILPAKLEHHPVDLDSVDAGGVVDAALQQVSKQCPELLAVAHALAQS